MLVAAIGLLLAACAGTSSGGDGKVSGDENGGKVAEALGPSQEQSMKIVTDYCAKYDKKGFVTRMDYDANTITFECRRQSRAG
jgi:hypothetical protein